MKSMLHLLPVFFCLICISAVSAEEIARVAVAANFSPVAEKLARHFQDATGATVKLSTGASGTLARQIQRGAPFELFLSADEGYIRVLHNEGLTLDAGRVYAVGVLVLFIPYTSGLNRMQDVNGLLNELAGGEKSRIALANPAIAPYGRASREVLKRFAREGQFTGREIIGENVGQAAQYALTGNVDAAFIPWSLALDNAMQEAGHFELIPSTWYSPIRQRMVLLKKAGDTAKAFHDFIGSETARQIIRQYGYSLPDTD